MFWVDPCQLWSLLFSTRCGFLRVRFITSYALCTILAPGVPMPLESGIILVQYTCGHHKLCIGAQSHLYRAAYTPAKEDVSIPCSRAALQLPVWADLVTAIVCRPISVALVPSAIVRVLYFNISKLAVFKPAGAVCLHLQ